MKQPLDQVRRSPRRHHRLPRHRATRGARPTVPRTPTPVLAARTHPRGRARLPDTETRGLSRSRGGVGHPSRSSWEVQRARGSNERVIARWSSVTGERGDRHYDDIVGGPFSAISGIRELGHRGEHGAVAVRSFVNATTSSSNGAVLDVVGTRPPPAPMPCFRPPRGRQCSTAQGPSRASAAVSEAGVSENRGDNPSPPRRRTPAPSPVRAEPSLDPRGAEL